MYHLYGETKGSKGNLVVKWNSVADADEYYVFRSTKSSGSYKKIAATDGTKFKDSEIKRGQSPSDIDHAAIAAGDFSPAIA